MKDWAFYAFNDSIRIPRRVAPTLWTRVESDLLGQVAAAFLAGLTTLLVGLCMQAVFERSEGTSASVKRWYLYNNIISLDWIVLRYFKKM
jgi:hypothetical protein